MFHLQMMMVMELKLYYNCCHGDINHFQALRRLDNDKMITLHHSIIDMLNDAKNINKPRFSYDEFFNPPRPKLSFNNYPRGVPRSNLPKKLNQIKEEHDSESEND